MTFLSELVRRAVCWLLDIAPPIPPAPPDSGSVLEPREVRTFSCVPTVDGELFSVVASACSLGAVEQTGAEPELVRVDSPADPRFRAGERLALAVHNLSDVRVHVIVGAKIELANGRRAVLGFSPESGP